MPNYLKNILHCNYADLALYTSIPFLVSYMFSLLCGMVCDYIVKKKMVTLTRARQIFTAIGTLWLNFDDSTMSDTISLAGAVVCAIFTVMIYYAELDVTAVVIYFTLAMGSMGGFYCGAQANFLDLCPNYAGALMGLVNGTGGMFDLLCQCWLVNYIPFLICSRLRISRTLFDWTIHDQCIEIQLFAVSLL